MKHARFRKKRTLLLSITLLFGLLLISTLVYLCILYAKAEKVWNKAYHPVSSTDKVKTPDTMTFFNYGFG
ncbi:hypothetical protein PROCOU_17199 [Listeria rocourtiae FSL F6-920]|nr:hypothetical protein PROCOU_17199 [Listeria rocourtiae FSL F6-920]